MKKLFTFPITPGNIGIAQVVAVSSLDTFGGTEVSALAYSMGSQGAEYLTIVGIPAGLVGANTYSQPMVTFVIALEILRAITPHRVNL